MSSLSISRAFTTRRAKNMSDVASPRNKAANESTGSLRSKISAPLELIHTTNMLSYNAPSITPRSKTLDSSSSSTRSSRSTDDETDGTATIASTPPTSPDLTSGDEDCASPGTNRLSSYFVPPSLLTDSHSATDVDDILEPKSAPLDAKFPRLPASEQPNPSKSAGPEQVPFPPAFDKPPAIPRRAPSHTKKASYEALARARSASQSSRASKETVSSKASFVFSRSSSALSRSTSLASHQSAKSPKMSLAQSPPMRQVSMSTLPSIVADPPHPFGQELAQVTEIAEEYGVQDRFRNVMVAAEEEEEELAARGLCKLAAEVYLGEVNNLVGRFFPETKLVSEVAAAGWI